MSVWETKKLGEVIKLEYGKPLPKEIRDEGGKYPAYGANGVKCWSNQYYLDRQSIIIGRKGSAGEVNLTNEKFWPLDVTYFVTYDDTQYDLSFLYHCLKHLQLTKLAKGVKPGINRNDVYQIEFAFPLLLEQKRIVAILDEAFEGIDRAIANTEKNLANSRELFESYLNAIFTQKGDSWVEKQLKDVCSLITDGKHGDCRNEENSGYFFLSAKDVKQNRLNYEGARQIKKEDFEETHRRTNLEPGDILITNSGTIGRTAIAPEYERTYKTTFQKSVALLKPIKWLINSEFCRYSLMAHINEIVGISAGTAQKNLLLRDLRSHRFYMPETVEEQKVIATKLDEFCRETQRLETTYRQKIAALKELKQSILQKAFTGELTTDTPKTVKEEIAA